MSTAWGEPWPETGAGVTRSRRDHQRAVRSKWTREMPVFPHTPHDPSVRLQPWMGQLGCSEHRPWSKTGPDLHPGLDTRQLFDLGQATNHAEPQFLHL